MPQADIQLGQFKSVIFDMDGLMFNTEEIYDRVGQTVLQRRGHEFTTEIKRKIMGRKNVEALGIMREHCTLTDDVETLVHETEVLYLELLEQFCEPMPGLLNLLSMLENRGIPKAVATSSSQKLASQTLGLFNLETRFQFIITGDDVTRGKPHPEIYLAAAQRLGFNPHEILALEDSPNGSLAAKNAGMYTVAIPSQPICDGDFDHVNRVLGVLDSPVLLSILGLA